MNIVLLFSVTPSGVPNEPVAGSVGVVVSVVNG
jgi:hypothetical protein